MPKTLAHGFGKAGLHTLSLFRCCSSCDSRFVVLHVPTTASPWLFVVADRLPHRRDLGGGGKARAIGVRTRVCGCGRRLRRITALIGFATAADFDFNFQVHVGLTERLGSRPACNMVRAFVGDDTPFLLGGRGVVELPSALWHLPGIERLDGFLLLHLGLFDGSHSLAVLLGARQFLRGGT